MKVNRNSLIQHLTRIMCNGQVNQAVFHGAFGTRAMTLDTSLVVWAPEMDGVEPFHDDVGMGDLAKLLKSLGILSGPGKAGEEVSIYLEDNRLVIDEEHRGIMRLMVAQPKTIGTRVEDKTVDELLATIPDVDGDGDEAPKTKRKTAKKKATKRSTAASPKVFPEGVIPLTRSLIEGIKVTFGVYKVEEVQLFAGPQGGRVVVGNENSDLAEFESAELRTTEPRSMVFGGYFVDVLSVVSDFSSATLQIAGPKHPALIRDGDFRYIISPRGKSADEKKKGKGSK